MNDLQRDFGRVEAKVEILTSDVKDIKVDLEEIKKILNSDKAVKESDWKRLTAMGLLATLASQAINWLRHVV